MTTNTSAHRDESPLIEISSREIGTFSVKGRSGLGTPACPELKCPTYGDHIKCYYNMFQRCNAYKTRQDEVLEFMLDETPEGFEFEQN